MNRFHRTVAAATVAALLSATQSVAALSFSRPSLTVVKPIAVARDEGLQYLSAGESGSGKLNFSMDEDQFAIQVQGEGLLTVDMSSANRVSMTLTDPAGKVVAAAGSGYHRIYRVQDGEYRLKVRNTSRNLLSSRNGYQIDTHFTPKPQQTALVVLLENGGVDIGEGAAVEVVNMTSLIDRMIQESPVGQAAEGVGQVVDFVNSFLPPQQQVQTPDTSAFTDAQALRQLILETTDGYLEGGTVNAVYDLAGAHYDQIIILEDGDFTADNVLSTIASLAPDYQIDIHALSHGAPNALVGFNGERLGGEFFSGLGNIDDLYLRSVYQMNCFGGTLQDDWVRVGAGAVNGSRNVNYLPIGYFAFLQQWSDGTPFAQAVQIGYDAAAPVGHVLYEMVDIRDEQSGAGQFLVDWTGFADPNIVPDEELEESEMSVRGPIRQVRIGD